MMQRTSRVAVVVAFAGVAAALAAAAVGLVLADIYRPHAPGVTVGELLDPARRSDSGPPGIDSLASFSSWLRSSASHSSPRRSLGGRAVGRRKALLIGAAAVAVVMSVVTVITRPLVEWDQLALRSVTVGSDVDGYWTAAFGDDVLFVLKGTTEVSQGEYVAALVTHLTAPAVTAAALLIIGTALRRRGEDEVPSEPVSTA